MLFLALALIQDPVVTGYVDRICRKLASHVTVSVAVDSEARAAALPDGGIQVTTGMIAGAHNEAELAGILAHEIAHAQLRETPCLRFDKSAPAVPGAREREQEADQAAIPLLVKAGYDPAAMLRYFSALRHSSLQFPVAFSAEDILIERLQLEATDHPMKDPVLDTPEFQAIKTRLK